MKYIFRCCQSFLGFGKEGFEIIEDGEMSKDVCTVSRTRATNYWLKEKGKILLY